MMDLVQEKLTPRQDRRAQILAEEKIKRMSYKDEGIAKLCLEWARMLVVYDDRQTKKRFGRP